MVKYAVFLKHCMIIMNKVSHVISLFPLGILEPLEMFDLPYYICLHTLLPEVRNCCVGLDSAVLWKTLWHRCISVLFRGAWLSLHQAALFYF